MEKQNVQFLVILAVGIAVFTFLFYRGIDRQERVRCFELQKQSDGFSAFYLTKSESEMCTRQGILIQAPVQ